MKLKKLLGMACVAVLLITSCASTATTQDSSNSTIYISINTDIKGLNENKLKNDLIEANKNAKSSKSNAEHRNNLMSVKKELYKINQDLEKTVTSELNEILTSSLNSYGFDVIEQDNARFNIEGNLKLIHERKANNSTVDYDLIIKITDTSNIRKDEIQGAVLQAYDSTLTLPKDIDILDKFTDSTWAINGKATGTTELEATQAALAEIEQHLKATINSIF